MHSQIFTPINQWMIEYQKCRNDCANLTYCIRGIAHRYPNRYQPIPKSHDKSVWKTSGHNSFGLHHENSYLQPFFCQHQIDRVYVNVLFHSQFILLTLSKFVFTTIMCPARALPLLISHPLRQASQPKTSTNHIGKDTTVQALQIRIQIPNHWMHTRQRLALADKMLKLPIFPQTQIENTSCKPMMQTVNKKLKKNKHSWIGGGEEPNTGNGC